MNKSKVEYIEKELRKVWNDDDFVYGILDDFEFDSELDEFIEFIDENKGKSIRPSKYTVASLNVLYGEGNWENGQLIEIVDDDEDA